MPSFQAVADRLSTAAQVRLDGAIVRYPSLNRPLGPIDLSIAPGEVVALVGASGAGKSTALRLLAGLETPTAGRIERAPDTATGFVFQSPTLMPWADARANVALPLELSGVPSAEARQRADVALAAVGLGDRTRARPRQLSGGMAMRVSLARAVVGNPDLLLLDEPFAALDSVTRRGLIEDLHRLWATRALAMVFVTHDVEEAAYLARRVVVLSSADGRVVADIAMPGSLPRPAAWRRDPAYREAVETVADALAASMGLVS
ncbi:MAG: ATP-binding cassette domain-containing protein [Brevundimonas sp.]|uniref:ABC transporter ATP-binding protein n=1 Tax=Brevundimonas sp. TaxID=1871086 RepID=UPI002736F98C|nr:ATP-binding cassette domain-containing protein [Brevundimonas sp.]MDP3403751.1 ATP-binding cassette domain-containing protein [Brevundimonas sp.]